MANSNMYCTMCYNTFSLSTRKPKVLPCRHLVCEKCLKQVCKNVQRSFSCPECHASHPLSKYPNQKEIVKQLEEIQKRKDQRKAQRRNSTLPEEKPNPNKKKSGRGSSAKEEIKEEPKEDSDNEKESTENLDETKDVDDDDSASREDEDTTETQDLQEPVAVRPKNKVIVPKRNSLVHSNSTQSLYNGSNNGMKPREKAGNHGNQPSNDRKMCSTHQKRFIMICKDHGCLICHECWKTKHSHCSTNDFWDEIASRKQSLMDGIYRQEATLKNYKDEVERAFDAYDFKSNKTLEDIKDCREMWTTEITNFFDRVENAIEKKLVQEREKKENFDENVDRILEKYTECKYNVDPIGENDIHKIFDLEKETMDVNRESDGLRAKTSSFENRKFMPKQRGTLLADARRRIADEMGCLGVIRVDVIGAPSKEGNGTGNTDASSVNRINSSPVKLSANMIVPKAAPAYSTNASVRRASVVQEAFAAPTRRIPESAEYIPPPEYTPPPAEALAAMGGCMPAPLHYAGSPPPYGP